MTQTESLATPTTSADQAATDTPKAKRAKKQRRFKLFGGDSGGDFRIYLIAEDENLPKGTLIPAPCPGFESTQAAQKFIKTDGAQFVGKQLMITKAIHIVRINLEEKPQVKVEFKPRTQVSGPPAS
jgi:hypothetical protein